MSQNVLEQMRAQHGRLTDVLVQNDEVCGAVMGLLSVLCNTSINQMGKPVAGIHVGDLVVDGHTFKARVSYHDVSAPPKIGWSPKREFADFVAEKAGALALALAINASLNQFFGTLVERLISHAEFKGFPFSALTITKHVITPDGLIILEVGRRLHV